MKKLLLFLVVVLIGTMVFSQDNLKVVKYIILDAELTKRKELKTFEVPEGEVWKIESALGEITSQNVELIINDKSYLIQMTPRERFAVPQLPFYLPGGTVFLLGAREDKGIVSICVLKIE